MRLVIVGSVALDSVESHAGAVENVLGGAAVFSSLAARFYCEPCIIGVIGDDFPPAYTEMLSENKIDICGLERKQGKTFRWKGLYKDLNRAETISTELNVFSSFQPQIPAAYHNCFSLLLANIHPELQLYSLNEIHGYQVSACDTMNYWIEKTPDQLREVISKVDILFINEDEIKQLSNENNVFKAVKVVLGLGCKYVVVKRGEYGSFVAKASQLFFSPIYPIERVVDPTGAGDSFAGGFMGYLTQQKRVDWETVCKAMIYGTVMASFNIERFSVDRLIETDSSEIQERYNEIKEWTQF